MFQRGVREKELPNSRFHSNRPLGSGLAVKNNVGHQAARVEYQQQHP